MPAGIGVGEGVGNSIVVGVALIHGIGSVASCLVPAASREPAAQPHRAMARMARSRERARICRYNGTTGQELPIRLGLVLAREPPQLHAVLQGRLHWRPWK